MWSLQITHRYYFYSRTALLPVQLKELLRSCEPVKKINGHFAECRSFEIVCVLISRISVRRQCHFTECQSADSAFFKCQPANFFHVSVCRQCYIATCVCLPMYERARVCVCVYVRARSCVCVSVSARILLASMYIGARQYWFPPLARLRKTVATLLKDHPLFPVLS